MHSPRFCRIFAVFGLQARPGPASPSGSRAFPPGGGAAPLRRRGGRGARGGAGPGARGRLQGARTGGRCAHSRRCAGTGIPPGSPLRAPLWPHRAREGRAAGTARDAPARRTRPRKVVGCCHPDPPICVLQPLRNATGIIYYCFFLLI